MAMTVTVLIPPAQAAATDTTQYTSTLIKTIIDKYTVTNTTAGPVTYTVNLVTSGGSHTAANTIISARAIAAGECYTCPELVGQVLNAGDFISTLAGAATSLTHRASGRQF